MSPTSDAVADVVHLLPAIVHSDNLIYVWLRGLAMPGCHAHQMNKFVNGDLLDKSFFKVYDFESCLSITKPNKARPFCGLSPRGLFDQELDASEQAILKANQLIDSFEKVVTSVVQSKKVRTGGSKTVRAHIDRAMFRRWF